MPTIKELKVQFNELTTELKTMTGGKDIFDDSWSPDDLVVDGAEDGIAKMNAYQMKASERKGVEDQLKQAEIMRSGASKDLKEMPLDSEWSFKDPNEASTGGIKNYGELRKAAQKIAEGYKQNERLTELKFDTEFLKAIVVAPGNVSTDQARQMGQQVMTPAFPTTDLVALSRWNSIDSNVYTRYEIARGSAVAARDEGADILDLNPTVPQRNFILEGLAGYIGTARESLEDIGQLSMALEELIQDEMRRAIALHAGQGTNSAGEWFGVSSQVTKTQAIIATDVILDKLRGYLIAAVANGYPYTHFLADATTVGKFVEALDKRGFSQYDRERFPFGHYLGCIAVPATQLLDNVAMLVAQDHMMIVHKGDVEVMLSEDAQFLKNALTMRATFRGNFVYRYPAVEGQKMTASNNFLVVAP